MNSLTSSSFVEVPPTLIKPASLCRTLILFGFVLGIILPSAAFSQSQEGRIEGNIKNPKGWPVAAAIVTVSGPVTRSQMSDPDGDYSITGLAPGSYALEIVRPGYVSYKQAAIEVKPDAAVQISVTLTPAPSETVVVTASRIEAELQSAPAAVSVVPAAEIAAAPASNVGDMLRSVPGLNVVQTSAREINLAARQSSGVLTNSQIALIDGRTIYSDFYDIVFWDLIPINTSDIKQIEVVRGPVAAVWGANAATGAVNIITKAPRDAPGMTLTLTGGGFDRDAGTDRGRAIGGSGGVSATYSQIITNKWSSRVSAGYTFSDAYPRPTGQIPVATSPVDKSVVVGGAPYSDLAYRNEGTRQPKFDLRFDQEVGGNGIITYEGGVAGSQGIILTPIGPFKMESGSKLGYGRVAYNQGGLRLSVYANFLDGKAPNLLTRAADGSVLRIDFKTGTYDIAGGYSQLVGNRHLLNYGINYRHNSFDISVAPNTKDREEVGGYLEDDIQLGKVHLPLGIRVDKITSLSQVLVSPRAAIVFKPVPSHSLRFSFNRAHRSPSAVDNSLDISIIGGYLPLGMINPQFGDQLFPLVTRTIGNPDLKPETLTGWEAGYTGNLPRRTTLGFAVYLNDSNNVISNNGSPQSLIAAGVEPYYTSKNPPPGWPLPPVIIDLLAQQGIFLPAMVKTLNYGKLRNKGFELSMDRAFASSVSGFANYSYQAVPQTRSSPSDPFWYPAGALSVPARNRFNAGVNLNSARFLGNLSVNYSGKAFWTDVRDNPYHGFTDAYTLVNSGFGVRWSEGKVITSVKGINLLNRDIRQHLFGDILKRRLYGEVQFNF
jgi:outer membrane receptor protein involved in Fe transport